MTDTLVTCAACSRHVRSSETACPFCRAARDPADPPRAMLAALAFGAALAGAAPALAQPAPRLGMEHAPAAGYGAPPFVHPGGGEGYGTIAPLPRAPEVDTRVVVTAGRDRALARAVSAALGEDPARWGRCRALDRRPLTAEEVTRVPFAVGVPARPTPGRPMVTRTVVGQCLARELAAALPPERARQLARRGEVVVEFRFRALRPDPR